MNLVRMYNKTERAKKRTEKFSTCGNCGHKGESAYWSGKILFENGSKVNFCGIVYLDDDGETFDLDPLLEKLNIDINETKDISGEPLCPLCLDTDYY